MALALAATALVRREFLGRRPPVVLAGMLTWSLFVFVQLGFGNWLTADYNASFQMFTYFAGTLVSLHFLTITPGVKAVADDRQRERTD